MWWGRSGAGLHFQRGQPMLRQNFLKGDAGFGRLID